MDAKLQQRVQRYGWDRAASDYEPLWEEQLAAARAPLLGGAALVRGQAVLDVACGTGLVSFDAARAVGRSGRVLGTDISGEMVRAAQQRATACQLSHVHFERMDAARLTVPAASFDVALCSLGLMYVSDPLAALRELRRAVRRGGRVGVAVWGTRERCGWAAVFPIVQAEVASEVCPLFFSLGGHGVLSELCRAADLEVLTEQRLATQLEYADASQACEAAFVGGPVALAWSRFDATVRTRVCQRYLQAIEPWRHGAGFRIPGEFVIVHAAVPA
jgi:ubiquinone/menaquinone biosynthesis C-methylase UbiE